MPSGGSRKSDDGPHAQRELIGRAARPYVVEIAQAAHVQRGSGKATMDPMRSGEVVRTEVDAISSAPDKQGDEAPNSRCPIPTIRPAQGPDDLRSI